MGILQAGLKPETATNQAVKGGGGPGTAAITGGKDAIAKLTAHNEAGAEDPRADQDRLGIAEHRPCIAGIICRPHHFLERECGAVHQSLLFGLGAGAAGKAKQGKE